MYAIGQETLSTESYL